MTLNSAKGALLLKGNDNFAFDIAQTQINSDGNYHSHGSFQVTSTKPPLQMGPATIKSADITYDVNKTATSDTFSFALTNGVASLPIKTKSQQNLTVSGVNFTIDQTGMYSGSGTATLAPSTDPIAIGPASLLQATVNIAVTNASWTSDAQVTTTITGAKIVIPVKEKVGTTETDLTLDVATLMVQPDGTFNGAGSLMIAKTDNTILKLGPVAVNAVNLNWTLVKVSPTSGVFFTCQLNNATGTITINNTDNFEFAVTNATINADGTFAAHGTIVIDPTKPPLVVGTVSVSSANVVWSVAKTLTQDSFSFVLTNGSVTLPYSTKSGQDLKVTGIGLSLDQAGNFSAAGSFAVNPADPVKIGPLNVTQANVGLAVAGTGWNSPVSVKIDITSGEIELPIKRRVGSTVQRAKISSRAAALSCRRQTPTRSLSDRFRFFLVRSRFRTAG